MSCDNCTDKEKAQRNQKLIEDATKQAKEKQAPMAICKDGDQGFFFEEPAIAIAKGFPIVQIISHLQ